MVQYHYYEYFSLLIGLILLIWFGGCRLFAPSLTYALNNEIITADINGIDELLNTNLQNGDLIFLAGDTQGERAIKFYNNSYYNHVCMVFRDERGIENPTPKNSIFIWESDLGQGYRPGPRIMKLYDKLDRWRGIKVGMLKRYISNIGDEPKTTDILNIAKPYIDRGTDMDITMTSWFLSDYPETKAYKMLKGGDKMFCSELLADTLQRLGIMENKRHCSWYSPENFASGRNVNIKKGVYGGPVYFTFDSP